MTARRSEESGDAIPPGWSHNPSDWSGRIPIIGLAITGFLIGGYLALYQFGLTASAWDPFFGDGTEEVLDSDLSRALLIPDAALGALAYFVDAVTGISGGRDRWRRAPWIVLVFGTAIGPLGLVSVLLVIAQPLIVGAWCTLCLVTAVISVSMIGPAMDEVLATLQHIRREQRRGRPLLHALFGLRQAGAPVGGNA